MKKYILLAVLASLTLGATNSFIFKFSPPYPSNTITSYGLYSGNTSRVYNTFFDIGLTNIYFLDFTNPKYLTAVSIYSQGVLSPFSGEVYTHPFLSIKRTNQNMVIITVEPIPQPVEIYKSTNLVDWVFFSTNTTIIETMVPGNCFYRAKFLSQ